MEMSLLEHDDAVLALGEYFPEIRASIVDGWRGWTGLPDKQRAEATPGTRAAFVHDLIVAAACRRIPSAPVMDSAGLKLFIFSGAIAIRFKKLDDGLCTRNQPTRQSIGFNGQQELEGIPAKHNLNAGYVLDPLEVAIVSIHLVCPNGDKPYWAIELHEAGYECKVLDLFEHDGNHNNSVPGDEPGPARWRRKESGVIVPFDRHVRDDV